MAIHACRILVLLAAGATAVRGQQLTNEHLRARFGPRGLTSITDVVASHTDHLGRDGFAITIGGTTLDSRTLPAPERERTADGMVYHFRGNAWQVHVTYALRPGWRFVSKQLRITALAARTFSVDSVTLLDLSLAAPPVSVFRPMSPKPSLGTLEYGAALRSGARRSLLVVAQNPFLRVTTSGSDVTMRYAPQLEWRVQYGTFTSDRALIAPVALSGRRIAAEMTAEWKPLEQGTPGLDEAEVAAFTGMVRSSFIYEPQAPLNVFVGWCANDYQIDVGTQAGRTEYLRLFDQAAAVGAQYVLYAPSNSAISRREQSMDDWSWEHVLWLGLGQKIRSGEWKTRSSQIPPSVQQMLDAAKQRKLGLLAYVYPVMPFSQDSQWLVPARGDAKRKAASLGNRALQDWLIEELVAFHDRTGIAGYSFDHTFLTYEGTSRYAQWYGWRRVMEELRRRVPGIVLDGRQAHHLYGPWSYLAGSYPHPTFHDEQPESFTPYPDLHFDRVSANRERYTAYRYRNYEFTPNEMVPGFMTHQTPRLDETDDMPQVMTADRGKVILPFRARDWDYLGWKYSVLSSIAVGGWNNVINLLPGRDSAEFAHFGERDRGWLRGWLEWTATNKDLLRHTRQILGQPALGKVDGSAMIDRDHGFIFLFNPDPRALGARVPLDASIGLLRAGEYAITEVHPRVARSVAPRILRGDTLSMDVPGGSAIVLEVRRRGTGVVNAPLRRAGRVVPSSGSDGDDMRGPMHPVVPWDSTFTGGRLTATLRIPQATLDRQAAIRREWPLPWTATDSLVPWLVPERLLLWAPIVGGDDASSAELLIDGQRVEFRRAYTSIQPEKSTFIGFWADLSRLAPDQPHRIDLTLPPLRRGQLLGVYLENVAPQP
ncbi:MAG: hypothetical protein IT355_14615 [Gemmatimonadaceae bacterium]|nr:hypothetical protein [Gemmatimonadaceae bacterium]